MGDHHKYSEFGYQEHHNAQKRQLFRHMSNIMTSKRVTVVCGGNGRIGKELCKMLVNAGHYVIVWDKDSEPSHDCYSSYRTVNLTNYEVVKTRAQILMDDLGEYDVLSIINVGYPPHWITHFGAFLYSTEIFAELMSERGGNIILFSSIYGQMIPRFDIYSDSRIPEPPLWYGMCKSAIEYMTRYLAKKHRNVRINCISPGGVKTDDMDEEFIHNYELHGDLLTSQSLNKVVMYLLSDENITGQNITIDNGFTL